MSIDLNAPVIVGVGEVTEPLAESLTEASSAHALAGQAAKYSQCQGRGCLCCISGALWWSTHWLRLWQGSKSLQIPY